MVRNSFHLLLAHLQKKGFTILTGARQTGKSTLMHELERYCKSANIPHIFLNLENKNILAELDETPLNVLPKIFSDR
jgi:predicted AAA+ superfamily ATPase